MSDISSKPAQRSAFSVRDICYSGLFAAVIAIMAQISIPMPGGVPMTMQTFAITLAAVVLGAKLSTVSCVIYLLLGAVGVPVLANFSGGFDKFIGPTGGFLMNSSIAAGVTACVLPFIPTAVIKAVLATVIGFLVRKRIPGIKA